jgi:Domain of unknown function (DUF1992).
MSVEKLIDKIMRETMARGEFDDLKGKGKPLNLDVYLATPDEVRMGCSVLKRNKFVPEGVDRLREISELKESLGICSDAAKKSRIVKILHDRELALAVILKRNKQKG